MILPSAVKRTSAVASRGRSGRFPALLAGIALGLASALLPAAASAEEQPLTPAQVEAVNKLIGEYLRDHPEAVGDALRKIVAQRKAEEEERRRLNIRARAKDLTQDPGAPVGGNPDGDVTLVEFFDYACPYCRALAPQIHALLGEDKKLRMVFKEFPILSEASALAARAALAAEKQHKYVDFHFALMGFHGKLTEDVVTQTAKGVGLDVERLRADMNDPEIAATIDRDRKLAEALGINGTPSFVIGDTLVPGASDVSYLKDLIQKARSGVKPKAAE
jgi:protein-disulfide isomerase